MTNSPDEETDEPLLADHRNYYKVEKWTKDGSMLYAGSSLDKTRRIFTEANGIGSASGEGMVGIPSVSH
jgi:hypothetical protein